MGSAKKGHKPRSHISFPFFLFRPAPVFSHAMSLALSARCTSALPTARRTRCVCERIEKENEGKGEAKKKKQIG